MKNESELLLAILVIAASTMTLFSLVWSPVLSSSTASHFIGVMLLCDALLTIYFIYVALNKILKIRAHLSRSKIIIKDINRCCIADKSVKIKDVLNINPEKKAVSYQVVFETSIDVFGNVPIKFMAEFDTKTKQNIFVNTLKSKRETIGVIYGSLKENKHIYGVIIEGFFVKPLIEETKTSKQVLLFSVASAFALCSVIFYHFLSHGEHLSASISNVYMVVTSIIVLMIGLSEIVKTYEMQEEEVINRRLKEHQLYEDINTKDNIEKLAQSSHEKNEKSEVFADKERAESIDKIKDGEISFKDLGWTLNDRIVKINKKDYRIFSYGENSSIVKLKNKFLTRLVWGWILLPVVAFLEFYLMGKLSNIYQKPTFIVMLFLFLSIMFYLSASYFKEESDDADIHVESLDVNSVVKVDVENIFDYQDENTKHYINKKIILFEDFAIAREKTFTNWNSQEVLEEDDKFSKKSIKSLDMTYKYKDGVRFSEFMVYNKIELIDVSNEIGKGSFLTLVSSYYFVLICIFNMYNGGISNLFSVVNFILVAICLIFFVYNAISLRKIKHIRKDSTIEALKLSKTKKI